MGLCLPRYLHKELCDEVVKLDKDVNEFVDKAVTEALKKERKEEKRR
jgi:phosphopantetheine adenylyltransferase